MRVRINFQRRRQRCRRRGGGTSGRATFAGKRNLARNCQDDTLTLCTYSRCRSCSKATDTWVLVAIETARRRCVFAGGVTRCGRRRLFRSLPNLLKLCTTQWSSNTCSNKVHPGPHPARRHHSAVRSCCLIPTPFEPSLQCGGCHPSASRSTPRRRCPHGP